MSSEVSDFVVVRGQKLEVSIDVARIEVVLPSRAPGEPGRQYPATLYAADPDLDIAILHIGAIDLPYVGLGDSDAVMVGDSVNAIGYPFGGVLDLDKQDSAEAIPTPSMTTGAISALRVDAGGDRRHVQLSAPLNPGNSGGPVVDAEGYAIGIAYTRLENATAIGLAVPINRVKRLIQLQGLDANLPVELITLGATIANPAKGLSIRAPSGFEDRLPGRLQVVAAIDRDGRRSTEASSEPLILRIDRIATAHSLDQLERALTSDGMHDRFRMAENPRRVASPAGSGRKVLAGSVSGTNANGDPAKLVYAIIDLGAEKIVARYVGSRHDRRQPFEPADFARGSRVQPLISAAVTRPVQAKWTQTARTNGGSEIPIIDGWVVEASLPWSCAKGLPPASAGLAMSPVGDFTVAFRAGWYAGPIKDLASAARQCSQQPGGFGQTSYATRADGWGVAYQVEGVFLEVEGSGVWQLEMIAPAEKIRFVAALFGDLDQGDRPVAAWVVRSKRRCPSVLPGVSGLGERASGWQRRPPDYSRRGGDEAGAAALIADVADPNEYGNAVDLAWDELVGGNTDRAFDAMEKLVEQNHPLLIMVVVGGPYGATLRASHRWPSFADHRVAAESLRLKSLSGNQTLA